MAEPATTDSAAPQASPAARPPADRPPTAILPTGIPASPRPATARQPAAQPLAAQPIGAVSVSHQPAREPSTTPDAISKAPPAKPLNSKPPNREPLDGKPGGTVHDAPAKEARGRNAGARHAGADEVSATDASAADAPAKAAVAKVAGKDTGSKKAGSHGTTAQAARASRARGVEEQAGRSKPPLSLRRAQELAARRGELLLNPIPCNWQVERETIQSIIVSPEAAAYCLGTLHSRDFAEREYRVMFEFLCRGFHSGVNWYSPGLLAAWVRASGLLHALESLGRQAGFVEAMQAKGQAAFHREYCRVLRDLRYAREARAIAFELFSAAYSDEVDAACERGVLALEKIAGLGGAQAWCDSAIARLTEFKLSMNPPPTSTTTAGAT